MNDTWEKDVCRRLVGDSVNCTTVCWNAVLQTSIFALDASLLVQIFVLRTSNFHGATISRYYFLDTNILLFKQKSRAYNGNTIFKQSAPREFSWTVLLLLPSWWCQCGVSLQFIGVLTCLKQMIVHCPITPYVFQMEGDVRLSRYARVVWKETTWTWGTSALLEKTGLDERESPCLQQTIQL